MGFYADAAAALADGCHHYWPMNEASGSVVADVVNGFDWAALEKNTTAGGVEGSIIATPFGNGRDLFPGEVQESANYIYMQGDYDTPDTDIWEPGQSRSYTPAAWSVRFRIYLKGIPTSGVWPVVLRTSTIIANGNGALFVYVEPLTGKLNLYSYNWDQYSSAGLTLNEWHDVIFSCDGTNVRLYIDGSLDSTFTAFTFKPYLGYQWGVADSSSKVPPYAYLDEIAFWDREITSGEVTTLAGQPLIGDASGPVAPPAVELPAVIETVTYSAKLTGAPDSLTDISLPISSFNARLRSARESYISIVVPHGGQFIEEIEARPNGEIVIYQNASEIARVNFQDLRLDKGPTATTLTLSGYKQVTYSDPGSWSYSSHSYYSKSGGKSRVRMQANINIKPGDYMTVEGATFVVDTVTLIGSVNRVYMELAE